MAIIRKQYIKLLASVMLIGFFAVALKATKLFDSEDGVRHINKVSALPKNKTSEVTTKVKSIETKPVKAKFVKTKPVEGKPIEKNRLVKSKDKKSALKAACQRWINFMISSQIAYSNNVFHYSRDKINEFQQLSNPIKFQGVKSIADTYNRTELELEKKIKIIGNRFTTFRVSAAGIFFAQNKDKNYGAYDFDVKQSFGKNKTVRLGYSYVPDYFLRVLFDGDYTGDARYIKAKYDKNRVFIRGWMELVKSLSGWAEYGFSKIDYNADFDERDNYENAISLGVKKEINEKLSISATGEFSRLDAKAHDNDISEDPDISSKVYSLGTGFAAKITKNIGFNLAYNFQWVDFTTNNNLINDPYHADRADKKQDISTDLNYSFAKNAVLSIGYAYKINDVKLAGSNTDDDELVGYNENIFSAKINLEF